MPATDYGWSLNEKPPIFQVFGTKRKCSAISSDNLHMVDTSPKRRCIGSQDIDTVTMETQPVTYHPTIAQSHQTNHSPQQLPIHQSHQMLCSNGGMQSPHYLENNNNNNNMESLQPVSQSHLTQSHYTQSHHMSHITNQAKMVTADHVSGDHSLHESVTSMTSMEEDMNPQQQQTRDLRLQETVTSMEEDTGPEQQQQGLSYCDHLCLGGDISPRSRRVKCYCIPSWEGLMDSRQYMSDYY